MEKIFPFTTSERESDYCHQYTTTVAIQNAFLDIFATKQNCAKSVVKYSIENPRYFNS